MYRPSAKCYAQRTGPVPNAVDKEQRCTGPVPNDVDKGQALYQMLWSKNSCKQALCQMLWTKNSGVQALCQMLGTKNSGATPSATSMDKKTVTGQSGNCQVTHHLLRQSSVPRSLCSWQEVHVSLSLSEFVQKNPFTIHKLFTKPDMMPAIWCGKVIQR